MRIIYLIIIFSLIQLIAIAQNNSKIEFDYLNKDSILKNRSRTIDKFYFMLNKNEKISTNQISEIFNLEREWKFVEENFSKKNIDNYYDSDWDTNESPIMSRFKDQRQKVQLNYIENDNNFKHYSIHTDSLDSTILIVNFKNQESEMKIRFKFYQHPDFIIESIYLTSGIDILKFIFKEDS